MSAFVSEGYGFRSAAIRAMRCLIATLLHDESIIVALTLARLGCCIVADWSRAFDDPIPLPRGRQIVTLQDAANHIQKLPRAEQDLEEWQAAVEALLLVVELNGPTMMARIGVSEH